MQYSISLLATSALSFGQTQIDTSVNKNSHDRNLQSCPSGATLIEGVSGVDQTCVGGEFSLVPLEGQFPDARMNNIAVYGDLFIFGPGVVDLARIEIGANGEGPDLFIFSDCTIRDLALPDLREGTFICLDGTTANSGEAIEGFIKESEDRCSQDNETGYYIFPSIGSPPQDVICDEIFGSTEEMVQLCVENCIPTPTNPSSEIPTSSPTNVPSNNPSSASLKPSSTAPFSGQLTQMPTVGGTESIPRTDGSKSVKQDVLTNSTMGFIGGGTAAALFALIFIGDKFLNWFREGEDQKDAEEELNHLVKFLDFVKSSSSDSSSDSASQLLSQNDDVIHRVEQARLKALAELAATGDQPDANKALNQWLHPEGGRFDPQTSGPSNDGAENDRLATELGRKIQLGLQKRHNLLQQYNQITVNNLNERIDDVKNIILQLLSGPQESPFTNDQKCEALISLIGRYLREGADWNLSSCKTFIKYLSQVFMFKTDGWDDTINSLHKVVGLAKHPGGILPFAAAVNFILLYQAKEAIVGGTREFAEALDWFNGDADDGDATGREPYNWAKIADASLELIGFPLMFTGTLFNTLNNVNDGLTQGWFNIKPSQGDFRLDGIFGAAGQVALGSQFLIKYFSMEHSGDEATDRKLANDYLRGAAVQLALAGITIASIITDQKGTSTETWETAREILGVVLPLMVFGAGSVIGSTEDKAEAAQQLMSIADRVAVESD